MFKLTYLNIFIATLVASTFFSTARAVMTESGKQIIQPMEQIEK